MFQQRTGHIQRRDDDPVRHSVQVHLDAAPRPQVVVEGESGGVKAAVADRPGRVVVGRLEGRFESGTEEGGFTIESNLPTESEETVLN